MPEYIDQNGNVVPQCRRCGYWRPTDDDDLCEMCQQDVADGARYWKE